MIYLPLHFKDHWSTLLVALVRDVRRLVTKH